MIANHEQLKPQRGDSNPTRGFNPWIITTPDGTKKPVPQSCGTGFLVKVGGFLYVVVEHHRHHEHQDILVGILGSWQDQTCTVWRRELQAYFLARKVVEHLYQKLGIEANFDILAIMVAGQTLICLVG